MLTLSIKLRRAVGRFSSLQINFLRETLTTGQCFKCWCVWWSVVHCPAETLILPHYAFEAQKFLPCLFSLDILVWMCSCLALKNLTEFRPKCWRFWFASSHKKFSQDQKIVVNTRYPNLKNPMANLPRVQKNLAAIIGSKHKKTIKPFPVKSLPKKCSNAKNAIPDQKITFIIMLVLSHVTEKMSSKKIKIMPIGRYNP